jgi:hypothetical protein
MAHPSISREMRQCITDCLDCAATCWETLRHCLELGGAHAAAAHITAMIDCAEICLSSAAYMARSSALSARLCEVCAEACDRCAEECERFPDDESMRRCAEICRRTAESCRRMAKVAA